jgi:NRE family putative nickel resistance protein-like MFS transporter
MLNKIIEFSVRNKLIIGLFILGLTGFGIYEVNRLPIDAVPDITDNQVQIITRTPAVIPQVVDHVHYRQAVGLSTATFQILGVLGPGLAGILAVWFGAREIFFIDAGSFVIAAVLILLLPADKLQKPTKQSEKTFTAWHDAVKGIKLLFKNPLIRFVLFIEFVSAISGAQILVNTVGHIKSGLHLTDKHYGWVMAAFSIGASIAAL